MFETTDKSFLRVRIVDHREFCQAEDFDPENHQGSLLGYYYYKPVKLELLISDNPREVLIQLESRKFCIQDLDKLDQAQTNVFLHIVDATTNFFACLSAQHNIALTSKTRHCQAILVLNEIPHQNQNLVIPTVFGTITDVQVESYSENFNLVPFLQTITTKYLNELQIHGFPIREINPYSLIPWPYTLSVCDEKVDSRDYISMRIESAANFGMQIPCLANQRTTQLHDFGWLIMTNNVEAIAYNLERMKEDLELRWNFDEVDFFNFCKMALLFGYIDIVIVLYQKLPALNIEINIRSLREFIKGFQKLYRMDITEQYVFESFSTDELDALKNFDAKAYREKFTSFYNQELPLIYKKLYTTEFSTDSNNNTMCIISSAFCDNSCQNIISHLYDEFYFGNDTFYKNALVILIKKAPFNKELYSKLYGALFKCLQIAFLRKNFDIIFFTFASLPLIKNLPGIANNNPYEFFQTLFILQVEDMFFLSQEDWQKITAVDNKVPLQDNGGSLKLFQGLQTCALRSTAAYARSQAHFVSELGKFVACNLGVSSNRKLDSSTLVKASSYNRSLARVLYPHQKPKFIKNDPVTYLIEAIKQNNRHLAYSCLIILRKMRQLPSILTEIFERNNQRGNFLDLVFAWMSLDVLAAILEFEECIEQVKKHIKSRGYIGHTFLELSPILQAILDDDFKILETPAAMAVSYYREDTQALSTGFYRGDLHLDALDSLFPQIMLLFKLNFKQLRITSFTELLSATRNFLIAHVPQSRHLALVEAPLAAQASRNIHNDLQRFPDADRNVLLEIAATVGNIQQILLHIQHWFNPIYDLSQDGDPLFVRIMCLGFVLTSKYKAILEDKAYSDATYMGTFSGRIYSAKPLKQPETIKVLYEKMTKDTSMSEFLGADQTIASSYIEDSRRVTYHPVAFTSLNAHSKLEKCGFFAEINRKSDNNDQYYAFYTAACMIGVTYVAMIQNADGDVKHVYITDPHTVIEEGYKIIELNLLHDEHIYDVYATEFFEKNMPYFKSNLQAGAKLKAIDVFIYYIHFGMYQFLHDKFQDDELFIQFATTVYKNVMRYHAAYQRAAKIYGFEVEFSTPLEKIDYINLFSDEKNPASNSRAFDPTDKDFNIREFASSLVAMMKRIDGDTPEEREAALVRKMLEKLRQPCHSEDTDAIAEVYGQLDEMFINETIFNPCPKTAKKHSPLLNMNTLDYQATLAIYQLESQGQGKFLGVLPADERHVFDGYDKNFAAKYGKLDTLMWMPTILPQVAVEDNPNKQEEMKHAKPFFMDYGIERLKPLVPEILHFQGMMAFGYKYNLVKPFLFGLQGLINIFSRFKCENNAYSDDNTSFTTIRNHSASQKITP